MDKASDLIPEHFRFVKGLVDSQDLSLNISREMLQHDRQLKLIADKIEKRISLDVDPTLLLDNEKWDKVATDIKEEPYIFVYSLSMPNEVIEFAKNFAKEKQKKIIFCTLDNLFTLKKHNNTVNVNPEGISVACEVCRMCNYEFISWHSIFNYF